MIKLSPQLTVLMYHGIVSEWTALPKEREAGADLYDVPTVNFQEQMEWLEAGQYKVDILNEEAPVPRQIILTFDDGEMNNYDQALPVLKKCGFPAYFFIIAKRIGEHGYMGWDELRAMHEAGMVIGSHGFSHEILTNLLDSQVEEELRASKRYLERNLNITVDSFSMPRGFCNNKVIRMAYNCGYKYVFISDRPRALKLECLSRVAIKASWPIKRFEQAVTGNTPAHERLVGKTKSAVKRVFGEGVYDWVRRTLLHMK
jgi:peptidoglycan/xylan/chitin deacetylase (PgdA/CDA1 family)